jgi:hypothetical protein
MSDRNSQTEAKQPTLNGSPVTQDQIREEKEKLSNNERIVEVTSNPGEFRKIKRMQG